MVCLLTLGTGPIRGDDGAGFSAESQRWILSVKKKFKPADVETAGGVFIPEKVKAAARAWKRIQTSAWF